MNAFDLTLPIWPLTGKERSVEDLARPDERSQGYGISALELQSGYYAADQRLSHAVPQHLRDRIAVARNLGAYAWFCYEFHTASLFWSISCIEMALRYKFSQRNPECFQVEKRNKNESIQPFELEDRLRKRWRIVGMPDFDGSFHSLLDWAFSSGQLPLNTPVVLQELRTAHQNRFYLIFAEYAQREGLVGPNASVGDLNNAWSKLGPEDQKKGYDFDDHNILTQELPWLRNEMAHPKFQMVVIPRSAIDGYRQLIEIVSGLWPEGQA